ncbi:MAG: type II toxin-antitoxin system RelE/ParE family toxin [Acidobacteria bacterium]|nr:type II toxin-antitoxin system RelE/ParE family toxin [Acidobacteriota bacterium]
MTGKIYFSEYIDTDLEEICAYIAERDGEAAHELILDILDIFRLISENKLIGTLRSDVMTGLRRFPFGNYNIFYFPTESGVEIFRVLHSSRDEVQIFDDAIDTLN